MEGDTWVGHVSVERDTTVKMIAQLLEDVERLTEPEVIVEMPEVTGVVVEVVVEGIAEVAEVEVEEAVSIMEVAADGIEELVVVEVTVGVVVIVEVEIVDWSNLFVVKCSSFSIIINYYRILRNIYKYTDM